jgi:hypothetical protein
MRHDLFHDRKSVHIKLTKELHTALRQKLFKYGVTMQDLFHEIAEQVLQENLRSEKLLQRVAKKRLLALVEKSSDRSVKIGELDSATIYNLLEGTGPDEEDTEE